MRRFLQAILLIGAGLLASAAPASDEARRSPVWFTRGSIYQLHLRAFTAEGTLKAAEARLPDVKEAGVDIVYLTPFMTKDCLAVDSEYGTAEDLVSFVTAAHRLGLKVLFDLGTKKETREFYLNVIAHWAGTASVDGFRCGMANDLPLETWTELRKMMQKKYANLVLICEGCNVKNTAAAFDASYSWPVFYGHVRPILRGKLQHDIAEWAAGGVDASHLRGAAQVRFAHDAYLAKCPSGTLLVNYIENRDTANDDRENRMEKVFGPDNQALGLALMYCLPGIPMIYNGQEICDVRSHSNPGRGDCCIDWTRKDSPVAQKRRALLKRLGDLRRTNPAFDAPYVPVKWLEVGDPERIIAFERKDRRGNGICFIGNLSGKKVEVEKRGGDGELRKMVLAPWEFKIKELKERMKKFGSDPTETAVKLEVVSADSVNLIPQFDNWSAPPNFYRYLPNGTLKPGGTYVVSCLIRPHAKDARVGQKDYGTGVNLTVWSKDWKRAEGIAAMGCGLGDWTRVYSEPWTVPAWGEIAGVFLKGNPEPDMVRDLRITPAAAELRVTATAPRPIRQVRVLDTNGATVADTGVMPGSENFSTNFTVAARGRYRVLAVDADGDIAWKDIGESDEK